MNELYLKFKQISIGFFKKIYRKKYIFLADVIFHYFLLIHPLHKKINNEEDIYLDYVVILWIVNKMQFDMIISSNRILWLYNVITGKEIDKDILFKREREIYKVLINNLNYDTFEEFYLLSK